MTLAIAATFPWGQLRRVVTSMPGASLAGGVILATDSRWSFEDARPPEDIAQKLWPLAPERGIGAVFAGDVWAAEDAFAAAKKRIADVDMTYPHTIALAISEALVDVYKKHKARRRTVHPLYVLVGMANRVGDCAVIKYSYASKFTPIYVVGLDGIGSPTAIDAVRAKLPDVDSAMMPRDGSGWSLSIDDWALQFAAGAFYPALSDAEDQTVGGGIQIATLSASGWNELSISKTSDLRNLENWDKISVQSDEVEEWRQHFRQPPIAKSR